jgi:hypothetical protein
MSVVRAPRHELSLHDLVPFMPITISMAITTTQRHSAPMLPSAPTAIDACKLYAAMILAALDGASKEEILSSTLLLRLAGT